jgi:hypothetical protein
MSSLAQLVRLRLETNTIMTKIILLSAGTILAILLLIVLIRPADFRVERSATLAASCASLFERVNNHHKVAEWNPFLKVDPAVRINYAGPESGVGAVCSWEGNSQVGAGSCTIIESKPNELVRCRMDWKRPMEGTSTVDFIIKPAGDGQSVVTWAMYGRNNFVGRVVSLFMDCEKICGPQFEQGLAELGVRTVAAAAAVP